VWIAPSGVPIPEEAAGAIRLEVSAEDDSGRRLLSESWPLHRTADAYLKFMKTFEPLRGWIGRREAPVGRRRLHRPDIADPSLPPGGAARSAAADRAAARGLAGTGRPASSAARSIAGCFLRPNNGLTGTEATKPARLPKAGPGAGAPVRRLENMLQK
jgi:hypothetical protein